MITVYFFHILMFVALVPCLKPLAPLVIFRYFIFHVHGCHWLQPGSLPCSIEKTCIKLDYKDQFVPLV